MMVSASNAHSTVRAVQMEISVMSAMKILPRGGKMDSVGSVSHLGQEKEGYRINSASVI